MDRIRIVNWNIEWMNHWFTSDSEGPPLFKTSEQAGFDVTDLARRVAGVIQAMQPDIITIQEGPSRKEEMAVFVESQLEGTFEIVGPAADGQQKLFCLIRKDSEIVARHWCITEEHGFSLSDTWQVALGGTMELSEYKFTREPLILGLETASGREIRIMNLHTKSKFVGRGRTLWRSDPSEYTRRALENRRRISAEAMRCRQ